MYSEINQEMECLRQGIARLAKINAILAQLQDELNSLIRKEEELRAILEKENLDAEKLEGRSLQSVFHAILGNLDERRKKERAEALAAKLKYDQAIRDVEDVKKRIASLQSESRSYQDSQSKYDALFRQKKEAILQENSTAALKILEHTVKIGDAKIRIKEIEEASAAGTRVLCSFNKVLDSLDRAEGWGTWDLFGGGLVSDLAKHSNIDSAKEEIEHTQNLLRTFHTELADVKISSEFDIAVGGFAKFADFFFDGLLADWYMQTKIHDSQQSVSLARRQVSDIVNRLQDMKAAESEMVHKWEAEMNSLIEETR